MPGDDHHQARLARPRRADQRDRLAGRDRERDAAQDLDRPGRAVEPQPDIVEQDERVVRARAIGRNRSTTVPQSVPEAAHAIWRRPAGFSTRAARRLKPAMTRCPGMTCPRPRAVRLRHRRRAVRRCARRRADPRACASAPAAGLRVAGIGGEQMREEGVDSRWCRSPSWPSPVSPRFCRTPRACCAASARPSRRSATLRPDAVVTIDSSGFCWRVAHRLRRSGETLPLIAYVAPMVWAWRPGRARHMARWYDHVLTLLPFEPPYFEKVGLAASHVGHPVLESGAECGDAARFRAAHGIADDELVLTVLPGSRGGEVRRLMPVFGEALDRLDGMVGPFRVAVPTVATVADRSRPGWPTGRDARSCCAAQGKRPGGKIRRLRREPRRARRLGHGGARTGAGPGADGGRLSPQPADRGAARPHPEGAAGQSRQPAARPGAGPRASAPRLHAGQDRRLAGRADPGRTGSQRPPCRL